jgi:hypothetical protein
MDREPQQLAVDDSEVSGLGPRLSPRARLRRLAISLAAVLLALLVVVAGLPALRQDALTLLIAPTPTPTLRSPPGADSFYFLATPPWVTVLVDGRPLDPVPMVEEQPTPLPPGAAYGFDTPTPTRGLVATEYPAPVQLARGIHTFEWRGAARAALTGSRRAVGSPEPAWTRSRAGRCHDYMRGEGRQEGTRRRMTPCISCPSRAECLPIVRQGAQ